MVGLGTEFLGKTIEVCVVTDDVDRALDGFLRLGVGPWRVYTFDRSNLSDGTYRGAPADFEIRVCFAQRDDGVVWELMQPLAGPTIFQEYLDAHGEGLHHVAYDCNELPWEERLAAFAERGFACVQSGCFADGNRFAFFETDAATGAVIETIEFAPGFELPPPERWVPAPPS